MNLKYKNSRRDIKLVEKNIGEGIVVPVLEYDLLNATGIVKHCFTTREGGVSDDIFSSMNLSFSRGDDAKKVYENYVRVAKAMGVDVKSIVCSDQTHTVNVRVITKEDAGNGVTREKEFFDIDGMITNDPSVTLATFYADCVPLFFVDPVHKAIGLSHSGWRGTVNRMGKVTLEKMHEIFGTNPEDVICAIGPSICQDCYEIGEEVAVEFEKAFAGRESEILIKKPDGKYQLDLWKANEIVLLEAGVKRENLSVTNICTCCNPNELFSHRASKGKRGNLGAFLALG